MKSCGRQGAAGDKVLRCLIRCGAGNDERQRQTSADKSLLIVHPAKGLWAAEIFFSLKQEARVHELLQAAAAHAFKFGESFKRSEFLTYLVKTSLDLDQLAIADELAEKITESDARLRSVCDIAARHALLDNFSLAQKKVMAIKPLAPRYSGYFQVINANPENRNFRAKLAMLNEIIDNIEGLRALDEADQILSECALQLAKLEKFHNALQVQEAIKSDSVRDELLWKLAELKFKNRNHQVDQRPEL